MPINKYQSQNFYLTKVFLYIFVPVCGLLFTFHIYIYDTKKDLILNSVDKSEWHEVTIFADALEDHFEMLISDLNYIAGLYYKSNYSITASPNDCADLATNLLAFSRASKIYDQVRLIGNDGVVLISINNDGVFPVLESSDRRLNEREKYYLEQVKKLDGGTVYISPFDLKMADKKVESPYQPMLRVAMSVPNLRANASCVIMLNYFGTDLLEQIRRQHLHSLTPDRGDFSLLNADGYWLLASDAADEWGFMFDDKKQKTFGSRYPEEWATIIGNERGNFLSDNGLFTYTTVRPKGDGLKVGKDYFWKLVSRLPLDQEGSMLAYERAMFIYIGVFLFVLSTGIAFGGMLIAKKKICCDEAGQGQVLIDPLTGLLNRRAFMERLSYEKSRYDRYGGSLVLIMGDIDRFKLVNARFGKEAGDYILRCISEIFQTKMRITDALCRWGGEEFMLLLAGNTEVDGVYVAEKVRTIIMAELFNYNDQDIPITMSFGVVPYQNGMSVNRWLKMAAQQVYFSKKKGRNLVSAVTVAK